jgi:hypothetical protein
MRSCALRSRLSGRVGGVFNQFHVDLVDVGIPERLKARNRQDPSQNPRTTFEAISLASDVDEDLANEILGSASVGDQSGDEVVNRTLCRAYKVRIADSSPAAIAFIKASSDWAFGE